MKGIIFDLDGTLVDSLKYWKQLNYDFFSHLKIVPNDETIHRFKSMSISQSAEYLVDNFEIEHSMEYIEDLWHTMAMDMYKNKIKLKPSAADFLKRMNERGVKLGVATASLTPLAKACLESNGVLDLFEFVIDVNMYNTSKCEPFIYDTARDMLGVDHENCVVFEDAPYAVKTASDAGYKVICVKDSTWGEEQYSLCENVHSFIEDYTEVVI